jgi:hypothetical protein
MQLARGQVWLDKEGGSREITSVGGAKLKYRYSHPGSALVKEVNQTRATFLERIQEFSYTLKGLEHDPPQWSEWPDKAPQLSWDEWDDETPSAEEADEWKDWQ